MVAVLDGGHYSVHTWRSLGESELKTGRQRSASKGRNSTMGVEIP